jgi:Domain of unknown function (DUF4292)
MEVNRIFPGEYALKGDITAGSLIKGNLTNTDFFIEKAEVKIVNGGEEMSGLGSIKFQSPDKYLISLRSKTGIEAARIFLTKDSVYINDRINKRFYFGSSEDLKKKYGVANSFIPVLLGDYINDIQPVSKIGKCYDNKLETVGVIKGLRVRYIFDCSTGKTITAIAEDGRKEDQVTIEYTDFFMKGDKIIPGKIKVTDSLGRDLIEIRIKKIECPWEGSVEFIPGRQYKKIHLL